MSRRLTRCRFCQGPVEFYASPFTGKPRKFDAAPIDGHHPHAVKAFPVLSGRAYRFHELAAVIQVQRECSDTEAEAEVRDMPWHTPHDCPNTPLNTTTGEVTTP